MTTAVEARRPMGGSAPVGPEHRAAVIRRQWFRIEQCAAIAVLVALPIRKGFGPGVTIGMALTFGLIPVWITAVRRYWGARFFCVVGLIAVVSGLVLSKLAAVDHNVNRRDMITTTLLVLGIIGGVGVILWSRLLLSMPTVGLAFGFGALLNSLSRVDAAAVQSVIGPQNQWKSLWAIPTTIIVLSLVNRPNWFRWQFVALLVLAAVSAAFDGRSLFATFLLAAVLIVWQSRPRLSSGRLSWVWTATLFGSLGYLMYLLGSTLLVDGFLGAEAQAKSIQQIDQAGSLILGGRPELSASWALFESRPWGFGSGIVPTFEDIRTAKAGMVSINYDPNNGYVEKYMFGDGIELHSILSDCWSHFGIPGIVFVATIGFLIVRGLAIGVSQRLASAVVLTFVWYTMWNLLFSPLYASSPLMTLTIGLCLTLRTGVPAKDEPKAEEGKAEDETEASTEQPPEHSTEDRPESASAAGRPTARSASSPYRTSTRPVRRSPAGGRAARPGRQGV